ncbi:MAG: hypothetical protein ABSA40_03855 [Candidatus Dormibacteria bacterium]
MPDIPAILPATPSRARGRRVLLSIFSLGLAVAPLVVSIDAPTRVGASGLPNIGLAESAPQTVLYGTTASVSLTASNPGGGSWGYNLSYEDVLPPGVSYVEGSTTPSSVGDPQVLTNEPGTHQTTLIWSNVSDLSPGSSNQLGFTLTAATDQDPVPNFLPNDSYTDSASAYVNTDPREVPQFSATGTASNDTGWAASSATTTLSPLAITQTPAGDQLRGVHDHQFVSTITVTNNSVHATDGITVDDWLPAGIEYLLCGQTDNTTDAPTNLGSRDEYPGSPLILGQLSSPANCVTPTTVATVSADPDGAGPLPTAVYTHVEWLDVASLAPSATEVIEFVAAIPIRENTLTWSSGSAPAGLGQAADLDNNSGAETTNGEALTAYATASGVYQGSLGSGSNPVKATGYDDIVARDLVTSKTVSDGTFTQGQDVNYTITVSTSEYRYSDQTTVTDTLPSGLCPLGDANYDAHSALECDPTGAEPDPAYNSVVENTDGTFTLVWDLGHIAPSTTDTITFPAADRISYQAHDVDTTPTVGNDTLTNTETVVGNLSVRCGEGDPNCTGAGTPISHDGPLTVDGVTATATASQAAAGPTLTVYVSQNVPAGDPMDCSTATYLDAASSGYPPTYQKGDRVCFQIDVSYPPGTDFKNPTVTDFIPPNTTYESGSATLTNNSTASNVGFALTSSAQLTWTMGSPLPSPDGNLYEDPATLFEVQFSVIASADPTVGNTFDLTQDLAKLVTSNTQGTTFTARDLVTYQLAAPVVTLTKAVSTINTLTAPQPKNDTVRGADDIGYTLTVEDTGVVDAYDVEVWDVLPAQENCTEVSAIVPLSGSCASGVIEWPPSAVPDLAPDATAQLTFTMEVRPDAGAGETFANDAGVRSFVGVHNDSGQPDNLYYPQSNIDPTVTSGEENTSPANDSADVITAGATVTKTEVSSITTPGNTNADATIGETIAYTVDVIVPHNTTFYTASLADPLGTQQTYVAGSGVVTLPDLTTFDEGSSAEGFTYAYTAGTNTVSLTFPTPYANLTSSDETVSVAFSVLVANVVGNARNDDITNTATLTDHSSVGTLITAANTPLKTLVVEPDVTIAKSVNPTKIQPGGTSTFTITVTNHNLAGVSSAFNLIGTDTIPAQLFYVAGSLATSGPGIGVTASESGGVITWSIAELDPGPAETVTYKVNPDLPANLTSGQTFINTATLTSWQGVNGGGTGTRPYGPASASATLTAEFPTLVTTKSMPDGSAAFAGEPFTWQVVVKNNTSVAVADTLAVTDTLPADWSYDPGSTTITFPSGPPSTADPTITPQAGGDILSWSGLGTLQPGQTLTVVYQATPSMALQTPATTGPSYPYPNSASASATDNTGASQNKTGPYVSNTSTVDAYIGRADLQIVKSHSGDFSAGADGTYTLTVTNNGPSTAGAPITVTDPMVSPESFVSAGGSNALSTWSCGLSGSTVTCTLDALAGGATTLASGVTAPAISLVVKTPSSTPDGTPVTNTASVSSPTYDAIPGNNTSSDPTVIDANADLAVTKSHSGSFMAGGQGTYTVSIENLGPSDAVGPLTVTDTLPSGESLVSATGTGWSCGAASGGIFTCQTASGLVSGAFAQPIGVVVDVAASQLPGTITNSASVSSPTNDPVSTNNTSNDPTTIVTSADLALTKVHSGPFLAGSDGTYDFTVTNDEGPSDAAGPLTVTDVLPSGESFSSGGGDGSGWTCSASAGTVTCTDPTTLDVGDSTSFSMTVAIASGVTVATLTNTATVGSPTNDPFPDNNTSTDNAGTTQSADLQLVKTLTSPLIAGQSATYSLAVSDAGPSDAAGPVIVVDTLPAGETYSGYSGTGWSCENASGTVTCTHSAFIVALAPASVITLTIELASDVLPTSISNTATVSSTTPDPDAGNNTSTATDSSTTSADLGIVKTDDGPFTAGGVGEYFIAVGNTGPSDAQGPIVVTDTLPSGETYSGAAGSGWSCSASGQVVTCSDDTALTADTSENTLTLTVAISPSLTSDSVTNDAGVSSPTSDPNSADNTSQDTTTVDTSADLSIVKAHTGDFTAGSDGTYTLTVTNHGPSDAALPLVVTDPVPSPFILQSAGGGSGWSCSVVSNTATCDLVAPLPAGGTAPVISIVVSVPSSQTATTIVNTASVESVTPDPNQDDNSASDSTGVTTSADLWVTKVHQATFTAGSDGIYLLTVGDNGPSDAAGPVTVSDTLPSAETYVSGMGADWSCSAALQVVTCTDADGLVSGASAPAITLEVGIASGASGTVSNTATVSSPTADPDSENNSATDVAPLSLSSDLSITKTHGGDFTAGLDGTYTIGVHNAGPSDSGTGVVVSDTLPAGERIVSAGGTGWACGASASTVTCTLSTPIVVAEDAPTLTLTVAVASGAVGTLTNVAVAQGPETDPVLSNNTASDPTTSDRVFDLSLTKTLTTVLSSGGSASYELAVTNNGPSDSPAPVTVTDPLPAGLTYQSSTTGTGAGWSCSAAGQAVTCIDSLAIVASTTSSFGITVGVNAPIGTSITNIATVAAVGDVDAADEIGTADGTVAAPAPTPDTGAPAGRPLPLTGGLLLLGAGLALVLATWRRRRRGVGA